MENIMHFKTLLLTVLGMVGGAISVLLGGWDGALEILIWAMAIDYISGLIVALVFKKSRKTKNGALESKVCFKGLCRKGMILAIVAIAGHLDRMIGTVFVRDAAITAFIINEIISIIENAGLMGIPMPKAITDAIDVLKNKNGGK